MHVARPWKLLALLPLLAVPAGAVTAQAPAAPPGPPAAPPRLVVFIAVDQLTPAYFDRFGGQFTGGLRRLHRSGAYLTRAYQDHANTETAPGHAAMLSGRFPRSTGIVANDRGVFDDQAPVIGGAASGASPFRFRGSVLYDWMRERNPAARALSVSRKDRGAILPMGRAGRDVYWYANDGRMTTSTYYRDTLPAWVTRFNARRIPQRHAGQAWTLLLPESAYAEADSVPMESGGQGFTFPHVLPADSAGAVAAFPGVPAMDDMLLQFALAGLHELQLGADTARTDLLAVSLSTTDAVGHRWGPDSREVHDHILRLDRMLGAFIDSLYRVRDSSTIAIALTSDHGVGSYPEIYAKSHTLPVPRVDVRELVSTTNAAIAAHGAPATAFMWDWGMVYVDRPALRRAGLSPDSVIRAFAAALRAVPGVARVDDAASLARRDTASDVLARRWVNAIPPDFDVPIVASLAPGAYWGSASPVSPSATHGSPHDYDAHVPVIFYGPWFVPGRYTAHTRVVDMAPTLARVIGVTPTERLDGRVLTGIIARR